MNCYKKRIRQFFRAVAACVTQEDDFYISKYLNCSSQKPFYIMNFVDQVHNLRTAYTIEKLFNKTIMNAIKNFYNELMWHANSHYR